MDFWICWVGPAVPNPKPNRATFWVQMSGGLPHIFLLLVISEKKKILSLTNLIKTSLDLAPSRPKFLKFFSLQNPIPWVW
jgi:hypothetical protein